MPSVDFSLEGRAALVTGGSKGIGRAIALAFAEYGADVAITARGVEALEAARADIEKTSGRRCLAVPADLSEDDQIRRLHERVAAELGGIDILVNNAAHGALAPLKSITYQDFEQVLRLNTWAAVYLAQRCLPHWQETGDGVIINISSNGGIKADPYIGAYSASKAAIGILSVQMAQEWGKHGVRANAICPGLTRTETADPMVRYFEQDGWSQNMLHKCAEPHEIAGLAVLLASRAGSYCQGELYTVDGGEIWRPTYELDL